MIEFDKTIAFQGALGANSDMACRDAFPKMTTLACRTFAEAFSAIREGKAKFAMIPIENTVAGRVADIHRLLPESKLHIVGEHFLRVNFHLFSVEELHLILLLTFTAISMPYHNVQRLLKSGILNR